ncbi:MAG: segregation/condensation protein A [Verrucomicrobiota bacterium]
MLELPGGEALRVELSAFTGPLDLLLHLIKEQEMDIYDIRLEKLTEQYLSRLDKMREENLSVAGEFLVMAATLVYLKSRSLLPVQDRLPEDVEDEDPKWELIRQLIEYRKFKEAAGQLGDREALHSRIFGRTPERVVAPAGRAVMRVSSMVRRLQHGQAQSYVLYILIGVLALAVNVGASLL